MKLSKGKAVDRWDNELFGFKGRPGTSTFGTRIAPLIPDYARPDNIWRCLSCKKFFYTEMELNEVFQLTKLLGTISQNGGAACRPRAP